MTTRETQNLRQTPLSDNISNRDKKALDKLSSQHQLTIKPSDKGGNIVLMSNPQYQTMCKKMSSNKDWYQPISKLTTEKFNTNFYLLINQTYLNNIISKQTWDFIRTSHPHDSYDLQSS